VKSEIRGLIKHFKPLRKLEIKMVKSGVGKSKVSEVKREE